MYLLRGHPSLLLAYLSRYFFLILLNITLQNTTVDAWPFQNRQDNSIEPDDPASDVYPLGNYTDFPDVDLYPTLDECRRYCCVVPDMSIFYSAVGPYEILPQNFANVLPYGVLMRQAFPAEFTQKIPGSTAYKNFMGRTSTAFAEKTSGVAHALLPIDGTNISDKVWTKIEKPILIAPGGLCNRIYKVDPNDFDSQCLLWDRSGETDPIRPNCGAENGPIPPPPVESAIPVNSSKNDFDWCGVHLVQYQKSEPSNPSSHYQLEVRLFYVDGEQIGQAQNITAATGRGVGVESSLPNELIITVPTLNTEAIRFNYNNQYWSSKNKAHQCNFTAYNVSTEGDCKFIC